MDDLHEVFDNAGCEAVQSGYQSSSGSMSLSRGIRVIIPTWTHKTFLHKELAAASSHSIAPLHYVE